MIQNLIKSIFHPKNNWEGAFGQLECTAELDGNFPVIDVCIVLLTTPKKEWTKCFDTRCHEICFQFFEELLLPLLLIVFEVVVSNANLMLTPPLFVETSCPRCPIQLTYVFQLG